MTRSLDTSMENAEVEHDAFPVVAEAQAQRAGARLGNAVLLLLSDAEAQRPRIATVVEHTTEAHRECFSRGEVEAFPLLLRASADREQQPCRARDGVARGHAAFESCFTSDRERAVARAAEKIRRHLTLQVELRHVSHAAPEHPGARAGIRRVVAKAQRAADSL